MRRGRCYFQQKMYEMKILSFVPILLLSITVYSQIWSGHIIDKETNAPISFVNITYKKSHEFSFSDTNGVFYINRDLVPNSDTITFTHIGYDKISLPVVDVVNRKRIELTKAIRELETVEVNNCLRFKIVDLNRHEKATRSMGVAPGLEVIFIGAYENKEIKKGYLHEISYYVAPFSGYIHIPLRLHWYEWNDNEESIGRELTDTSLVIYPTKKRWNQIALPNKLISVSEKIVIGIEFIYPADIQLEYWKADKKMKDWIWRNRQWSIGMTRAENESFQIWGGIKKLRNHPSKPALRFKVRTCE